MIRFLLRVEDLADTRFALSPLHETVFSLWALRDPGRYPLHLAWRAAVLHRVVAERLRLLLALVGDSRALPDFLTPPPVTFDGTVEQQLDIVRQTPVDVAVADIAAAHAPQEPPELLVEWPRERLVDDLCDLLLDYWTTALAPHWSRMRLVLESDMTYRARQLATGGARLLFAEIHPNLRWDNGVLEIHQMIGDHAVPAAGRGLLLIPSIFAYKPVPPLDPGLAPRLSYPSRGVAGLWASVPARRSVDLDRLIGASRARVLMLLDEPQPTNELARRLGVTPSAVSQHLGVLHVNGLVTRARDGRRVLYRRSALGDQLASRGS